MIKFIIGLLFFAITGHATLNEVDKQAVWGRNVLANGGFENGKAGWTASGGTFALVTSSTNLLTGKVSATWDSGSAAQTLTAVATIPQGLYGKNGVLACKTQTPSGTATHTLGISGVNGSMSSSAITSSTTPVYDYRNFIFPSSGSVTIAITSVAADEPLIAIDDCFLGDASEVNLSNISQAQFIGSAYFATTASCNWTNSGTSLDAFGTDTDCPGPTVESNPGPGTIQTTDADLPRITVNNLPPGRYEVVATFTGSRPAASAGTNTYALTDGSVTTGHQAGQGSPGESNSMALHGLFEYTTAGNRTFEIYSSNSAGSVDLSNDTGQEQLRFHIKRFPLSTEQAYRPDVMASSWSGYHDNTCSWARTNTAFGDPAADATCGFTERTNANFGTVTSYLSGSDKLPGIVFTPKKAGRYYVCAHPKMQITNNVIYDAQLTDGTTVVSNAHVLETAGARHTWNLCGIYVASSTTSVTLKIQTKAASGALTLAPNGTTTESAIEWSIFAIDQQLPAPLLVNSVVSKYPGVMGTEHAEINCDASSSLTSNPGSWLSSIGNRSTASCALTIASGVFSATPYSCQVTVKAATVQATSCSCSSSTSCTVYGASADWDGYVSITGPR